MVTIGGIGLLAVSSGMALASYGPTPLTPTPIPGGFQCVVTSLGVGQAGKVIGPIPLHGMTAHITVQPDSFGEAARFQLTITQPEGSNGSCPASSGPGGQSGHPAVEGTATRLARPATRIGGIGILVQLNGSIFKARFRRPLLLRLTSTSINRSSRVEMWSGRRFIVVRHAVMRTGSARVRVYRNHDYEAMAAASYRRTATTAALQPVVRASRAESGREFLRVARLLPARAVAPGLGVVTGS